MPENQNKTKQQQQQQQKSLTPDLGKEMIKIILENFVISEGKVSIKDC